MADRSAARAGQQQSQERLTSETPGDVFTEIVERVDDPSVDDALAEVERLLTKYVEAPFYDDLTAKVKAALVASGRLDGRASTEFNRGLGRMVVTSFGSLDSRSVKKRSATGSATSQARANMAPD